MTEAHLRSDTRRTAWRAGAGRFAFLAPIAAALAYPYLLKAFHAFAKVGQVPSGETLVAVMALVASCGVPLFGLLVAARLGQIATPTEFEVRARRLAFISIAAPPFFVLFGVGLGLLGSPVRDLTAWTLCWGLALLFGAIASDRKSLAVGRPVPRLRVFHGAMAAILVLFVVFHLGNHLVGLAGPETHARVMDFGRTVYRSGVVEPILIGLLLTQIVTGGRLAWNWTSGGGDIFRTLQVGSGVYVGAFIITHLNSALISARAIRGIPTNWAWASGAPEGLLMDSWNIRLVPHYAFGVFFVLLHLCLGLRIVLISHGVSVRAAGRMLAFGAAGSGIVAFTIIAALMGVRV